MGRPATATYTDAIMARVDQLIQDWAAAGLTQQQISDRLLSEQSVVLSRFAVGRRLKGRPPAPRVKAAGKQLTIPGEEPTEIDEDSVTVEPVRWQDLHNEQEMMEAFATARESRIFHLKLAHLASSGKRRSANYQIATHQARIQSLIFAEMRGVVASDPEREIKITLDFGGK